MIRVLLINQDKVLHYRVPVYGYMSRYLQSYGYEFMVVSEGIQPDSPHAINFQYEEIPLSILSLTRFIFKKQIDIIIFWVDMKHLYLFPIYLVAKALGIKTIHWGHGRDLEDPESFIKNTLYALEQYMCDAIILYADYLKKYISHRFYYKTFVANNTLDFSNYNIATYDKNAVLSKYGIRTRKNIICMGRMQRRKRIGDLVQAYRLLDYQDVGLILVGSDPERVLDGIEGESVYKLGPVYGVDSLALLSAADVYCLPGHVGLSIVDAFYCGLPVVTEDTRHAPEIMYLKNGINGFIVPKGDVNQLAAKLRLLLEDETLWTKFSRAAKDEIIKNGHIDVMCKGFLETLCFVSNKK